MIGSLNGSTNDPKIIIITNSINSGSVSGSRAIGGLVGFGSVASVSPKPTIKISDSMNSGSLTGNDPSIGGLIGFSDGIITIKNSINCGGVSGSSGVGGLIGESTNEFYVFNSVNFGTVVATNTTTLVGGIAGLLATITNDYEQAYHYGSITSNGVEVVGTNFGTKVTDISSFNLTFFTTTLGWDTEIWNFTGLDIANGVYPTLKNMPVVEE